MATVTHEIPVSSSTSSAAAEDGPYTSTIAISSDSASQPRDTVLTTVHSFPALEPLRFAYYPNNHLYLPLRKDILHRAVIYEGDMTRQGTASTKWRDDVHGSHRKLYRQKGTGKARVGDKQSPIRRGGGVAFGPHPRDFSTKLNKKVYDLAWRTALSFRYRKGELVVVDRLHNLRTHAPWWLSQIWDRNGWGKADGRSLMITDGVRDDNKKLFTGLKYAGELGRILSLEEVDVKDILELGSIVIEQEALNKIFRMHRSDLVPPRRQLGSSAASEAFEEIEEDEPVIQTV